MSSSGEVKNTKKIQKIIHVCCFIIEQVWINLGDVILLGLRDYQVQYALIHTLNVITNSFTYF